MSTKKKTEVEETSAAPAATAENTGSTETTGDTGSDQTGDGSGEGAGDQTGDGSGEGAAGQTGTESAGKTAEPKTGKVSEALKRAGRAILKSNPGMKVVHVTSDGRGFYEKNDADLHARTLKDKTVVAVK